MLFEFGHEIVGLIAVVQRPQIIQCEIATIAGDRETVEPVEGDLVEERGRQLRTRLLLQVPFIDVVFSYSTSPFPIQSIIINIY